MLDLVPFARPGWIVTHGHRHPEAIGKGLQMHLPRAAAGAVAPAGIGADQQPPRLRVRLPAEEAPPPADALDGEFRRLVGNAHVDDGLVPRDVVGPVRDRLAHAEPRIVMDIHRLGLARWLPAAAPILE